MRAAKLMGIATMSLLQMPGGPLAAVGHEGLTPGPFGVGYRQAWLADSTRSYANLVPTGPQAERIPRLVLVSVWYPSQRLNRRQTLRVQDYFAAPPITGPVPFVATRLMQYSRSTMESGLLGKPVDSASAEERRALQALLNEHTQAALDASPVSGRFPIVVYHAGAQSPFTDNALLCEFLASYGYVVVTSIYPLADGSSPAMTTTDGSSVLDMRFLIDRVARLAPGADWQHVAVVGHSAGAQTALILASWPASPVDAIVSLDNTEDYHSLAEPSWDYMTTPVLAAAKSIHASLLFAARPDALFEMANMLDRADRSYVTLPDLRHDDFVSIGILRRRLIEDVSAPGGRGPSVEAQAQDRARSEYEWLCRYQLAFLDAALKRDSSRLRLMNRESSAAVLGKAIQTVHLAAGIVGAAYSDSVQPPSPAQLRALIEENGVDAALVLLRARWPADSTHPDFGLSVPATLLFELIQQGDTLKARKLYEGYESIAPNFSALIGYIDFVADSRMALRRPAAAAKWYRTALAMSPSDTHARTQMVRADSAAGRPPRR